jgi:hypothetical protein
MPVSRTCNSMANLLVWSPANCLLLTMLVLHRLLNPLSPCCWKGVCTDLADRGGTGQLSFVCAVQAMELVLSWTGHARTLHLRSRCVAAVPNRYLRCLRSAGYGVGAVLDWARENTASSFALCGCGTQ